MDFEHARLNMIEQQIRTWEVLDQDILDIIANVHREDFIPEEYRQLAFADTSIPLIHGQFTLQPKVEARLLQYLAIQQHDTVLEVGTGCAYLTALLGRMAAQVHSVDIFPEFTNEADAKLARYGLDNIQTYTGDALYGWEAEAPYDVIVVTGSVQILGSHFQQQLTLNGRLAVIVGESPVMEALLITRTGDAVWTTESIFDTDVPALIGVRQAPDFHF